MSSDSLINNINFNSLKQWNNPDFVAFAQESMQNIRTAEYEHGFVYATIQDILGFDKSAQRKLGQCIDIKPATPDIIKIVNASNRICYSYKETAPRKISYKRRMRIKEKLGKYRPVYSLTKKSSGRKATDLFNKTTKKEVVIEKITAMYPQAFFHIEREFGSFDIFYKCVNNNTFPVPEFQTKITTFLEEIKT